MSLSYLTIGDTHGLRFHLALCRAFHRCDSIVPCRCRIVIFDGKLIKNNIPEAADAGDDLNDSGFPLGTLFVSGGVIFIVIAAAILMGVLKKSK